MRKKNLFVLGIICITLIITILFTGCQENVSQNSDAIGIIVTIVPQVEMVEAIGRNYIDVTVMVPAGQSPHSSELTPEQLKKVAVASAYFKVGSGIEFELTYMNTIIEQNPDLKVFDCSKEINVVSFDEHYGYEHNKNEQDQHEGSDPHIWTSPENFKKMAKVVYEGLVEIDSTHQSEYYDNYQAYIQKLDKLNNDVKEMLEPYKNQSFMVYHPAWGYFGDAYHFKQIAIENEGKQPGPDSAASVINQAKNLNITVIFVAPQFDTSTAEVIAEEIGGEIVFANPLMDDYNTTIRELASGIIEGSNKS